MRSAHEADLRRRSSLSPKRLMSALIGIDAERYSATGQGGVAGMLHETFVSIELVRQQKRALSRTELYF